MARLATCDAGYYRTVGLQAALLISAEPRAQLQVEGSLGQIPLRQDLLSVIYDARAWCLQCIKAGETNVKGYLLMCVIVAQIEGLKQRLDRDDIAQLSSKAVADAWKTCLPVFEEMAGQPHAEGTADELHEKPLGAWSSFIDDWDFMVSEEPPYLPQFTD